MRHTWWCFGLLAFCLAGSAHGGGEGNAAFFNGKDLDGWEGLTDDYWTFKHGTVMGLAPQGLKFNTFLCSKKKYGDFELKFQVWLIGDNGNSGVQIRSHIHDRKKFAVTGPQCDMGQIYWGSLYGENFGGMMKQAPKEIVEKALKKNQYNDYYIKAVGKHVTIKLNGQTTVDDDFDKMPAEGIIAFQLHGGGPMAVFFRNIEFKDLSK